MNQKFGRVKAFVEELEKVEFIENEEALLLLGSSGGIVIIVNVELLFNEF